MKVRNMVIIAVFASLSVVLSFFKVFQMPQGGSISLYMVPLMFIALRFDFKSSLICCLVSGLVQLMFATFVLGFFQVILDYILPLCLISLLSLVDAKNLFKFIPYATIVGCAILGSHVVSGMLNFGANFIGSLTYNASYLVPTYVISIVIVLFLSKVKLDV